MFIYYELHSDQFSSKFLPHGYGINISGMWIWTGNNTLHHCILRMFLIHGYEFEIVLEESDCVAI